MHVWLAKNSGILSEVKKSLCEKTLISQIPKRQTVFIGAEHNYHGPDEIVLFFDADGYHTTHAKHLKAQIKRVSPFRKTQGKTAKPQENTLLGMQK